LLILIWNSIQYFDCTAVVGEISSALAQEKEVQLRRRNFLGMLGSEMGDPGHRPQVTLPELLLVELC